MMQVGSKIKEFRVCTFRTCRKTTDVQQGLHAGTTLLPLTTCCLESSLWSPLRPKRAGVQPATGQVTIFTLTVGFEG